jgi:hypothetical protein
VTRARTPLLLLAAVAAVLEYCAFASGGTQLPAGGYVAVAVAVLALAACAACLYGPLRFRPSRLALGGLAALALFAAWTGASIGWSAQPDRAWIELNLALAYLLALGLGIVLGSSLPRGPQRVGTMLALVSMPVALYALGGKTLPGLHVDGLFDLDQAAGYNRLKAPLHYWNALALFCVIGLLPMLRLAADPRRAPGRRIGALLGVYVLALVVALTYSRGGLVALVAGVAVLLALGTERVRTAGALAAALAAAAVPLTVALTRDDLTTDLVALSQREDDALVVLVLVVLMAVLLAAAGAIAQMLERRPAFSPRRARRLGRPVAAGAAALAVLALAASLASGRVAEGFDAFTDPAVTTRQTDPNRLLSANSGNRWTWWKEAAGAWSDEPLAGWGAGSFPATHRLYRRDLLTVQQPHSVPLQWLAELGLVGFVFGAVALLALLAAALARVRRARWALEHAPPERGYAAALLAVAVAWAVHAVYDWDWDIPAVTLPAMVALGTLGARPPASPPAAAPAWRGPALACAVVAFALVATSALLPSLARTRIAGVLASVGGSPTSDEALAAAAADAEVAARLNPLAIEPLFAVATIADRRERPQDERDALLRAVERQPESVFAWVRLAAFELLRGEPRAGRRATLRALELDPRNPALINLAARTAGALTPPERSATATGAPLPTEVAAP